MPGAVRRRDLEARNLLVEHNLRLVAHIIKKYYTQTADQEDLISIGTIGLIKAVNTFRPDRGIKLATYASRCIENEILMHFRAQRKVQGRCRSATRWRRAPRGMPCTSAMWWARRTPCWRTCRTRRIGALLRRLIAEKLTKREADILRRRYGLDGRLPQTQRQVAAHYGISRSYVSAGANVSEARKALICNGFRASDMLRVAPPLL